MEFGPLTCIFYSKICKKQDNSEIAREIKNMRDGPRTAGYPGNEKKK